MARIKARCSATEALPDLDRAPALAPHVHPNYYAAYLRDPDGRLVKFTCHEAESQG